MGMMKKLEMLSARQHALQTIPRPKVPSAPETMSASMIPRELMPLIVHHGKRLLAEWLKTENWRTTRYIGSIIIYDDSDDGGAYIKLHLLEPGIAELKCLSNQGTIHFSPKLEAALRMGPKVRGKFCLPLYVSTPACAGVMFLTTDGPS